MTPIDFRPRVPGAAHRAVRSSTKLVVLHKIGADRLATHLRAHGVVVGDATDAFEVIRAFFCEDAEGVATVTLSGGYASNRAVIARWYAEGIPTANAARAHVPYHFVVDKVGRVAQFLDHDRVGAHAGHVNGHSIAVACVGDFDVEDPAPAQLLAVKKLVRNLLIPLPSALVVGHDDTKTRPKGCPGSRFPVLEVSSWAQLAAKHVRERR